MAAISTMSATWSGSDWSLNVGGGSAFSANSSDATRLDCDISSSSSYVENTSAGWDLTGSSWSCKWHYIPSTTAIGGPGSQMSIEWRDNGTATTGYRLLRSTTGTWSFQKAGSQVGAGWTDLYMRAHPWCRIRESGGTTYFELSADGTSGWAQPNGIESTTNYSTITNLKIRIQPSAVADAGYLAIQEVNGATAPSITDDPTIFWMQQTCTTASAAVNTSPTAPTVTSGDLSILCIAGKVTQGNTATSTTPSGWTIIGAITQSGTAASQANDTGDTAVVLYQRQDSGYGNPTISTTNFNSMSSSISVFRSTKVVAGGTWDVSSSTTGSDTSSGSNISITGAAGISGSAGDVIAAFFAASGDVGSPSAFTVDGMSGATFIDVTTTFLNREVTTGQDSRQVISTRPIISGSSSNAPTFSYTNSSSTTGHARILRIRDVAGGTTHNADSALTVTSTGAAVAEAIHEGVAAPSVTSTGASVAEAIHEASSALTVTATAASVCDVTHEAAAAVTITATGASVLAYNNDPVSTIPDDFTDTDIWFANGSPATYNHSVDLPQDTSGSSVANELHYTLVSSEVFWKVVNFTTGTSMQLAGELRVNGSSSNMVRFLLSNATMFMRHIVGGSTTTVSSYSWSDSRPWLQLREDSGTVYWEDSANGSSWTSQASWTHSNALDFERMELWFYASGPNASGPSVTIQNLNNTGTTHEASAALTVTEAGVAAAYRDVDVAGASTITSTGASVCDVTHEALAASTITETGASVCDVSHEIDGSLTVTEAGVADAYRSVEALAALTVTETPTSSAVRDFSVDSALTITETGASVSDVTHEASSALTVTAAGVADAYRDISAVSALTVTETAAAVVTADHEAAAAITVTVNLSAVMEGSEAEHEASSSLTVTETGVSSAYLELPAVSSSVLAAGTESAAYLEKSGSAPSSVTAGLVSPAEVVHEASATLTVTSAGVSETAKVASADGSLTVAVSTTSGATRSIESLAALTVSAAPLSEASLDAEAVASLTITASLGAVAEAVLEALADLAVAAGLVSDADLEIFIENPVTYPPPTHALITGDGATATMTRHNFPGINSSRTATALAPSRNRSLVS